LGPLEGPEEPAPLSLAERRPLLPPYPGFSDPEDWREYVEPTEVDWDPRTYRQAVQLTTDAEADHPAKHRRNAHPWCTECHNRDYGVYDMQQAAWEKLSYVTSRPLTRSTVNDFLRELNRTPKAATEHFAATFDVTIGDVYQLRKFAEAMVKPQAIARRRAQRYLIKHNGRPPVDDFDPDQSSIFDAILFRHELKHLPKPQPLIDKTIDAGSVTLLAGYWGTCKSFIAQDWAASIASARPQWQARTVARHGDVLYIAAEGAHGLDDRFTAWEKGWRYLIGANGGNDLVVLNAAPHLGKKSEVDQLCELISDDDSRYTMVVIDTLSKCIPGLDENSAKDIGPVVSALYRIQQATGDGTVLVVHHTGKDKVTVRGSSALESGVDCVYLTEGDAQEVTLKMTKRKDGPLVHDMKLRLDPVEYTSSAVIVAATTSGGADIFADISGSSQKILSAYMSAFSETGATKADLRKIADMPTASFHRGLNALVEKGELINTGTDKRPFYKRVTN